MVSDGGREGEPVVHVVIAAVDRLGDVDMDLCMTVHTEEADGHGEMNGDMEAEDDVRTQSLSVFASGGGSCGDCATAVAEAFPFDDTTALADSTDDG